MTNEKECDTIVNVKRTTERKKSLRKKFEKSFKNLLTNTKECDTIKTHKTKRRNAVEKRKGEQNHDHARKKLFHH